MENAFIVETVGHFGKFETFFTIPVFFIERSIRLDESIYMAAFRARNGKADLQGGVGSKLSERGFAVERR